MTKKFVVSLQGKSDDAPTACLGPFDSRAAAEQAANSFTWMLPAARAFFMLNHGLTDEVGSRAEYRTDVLEMVVL